MSLLSAIKKLFGFSSDHAMGPNDRLLPCEDCGKDFVFDEGEQRFFKQKGFSNPKRCPRCRKQVKFRLRRRRGRGGNGSSQTNSNHHDRPQQGHRRHHERRPRGGRSVIDSRSPYVDER